MPARSLRAATATTIVAAVVLTVGSGSPTARASSSAAIPLHVLLTVSSNLTAVARATLISETERIWRREQVHIEWARPAQAAEPGDAPLRVLVVARPQAAPSSGRDWPVAELFPEAAPRALAIASIDGAERVVNEASRATALDGRDYRLGLVLGRAIAHEIGHFLLATPTHAPNGLMRGTIDSREFAAVDGDAFRLDSDASQWLRHRLAESNALLANVRERGFSYER